MNKPRSGLLKPSASHAPPLLRLSHTHIAAMQAANEAAIPVPVLEEASAR